MADAAFTGSRTALAVVAFTERPELLFPATVDRLHQEYRRPAYPESASLVDALRVAGVPAVIFGAGPTVLALTTDGTLPPELDLHGFTVLRLRSIRLASRSRSCDRDVDGVSGGGVVAAVDGYVYPRQRNGDPCVSAWPLEPGRK